MHENSPVRKAQKMVSHHNGSGGNRPLKMNPVSIMNNKVPQGVSMMIEEDDSVVGGSKPMGRRFKADISKDVFSGMNMQILSKRNEA
jgi:hypothetical protein